MPKLEIVAIQRPAKPEQSEQTTADQQVAETESARHEKQVNKSKPQQSTEKLPFKPPSQSIAVFTGHLAVQDDRLYLQCSDSVMIPVIGIDGKLSLWLLSHTGSMFATDEVNWLVYPKADRKDSSLTIHLKSRLTPDRKPPFEPETGIVRGKLLAVDGDKMTIGIRRNLSPDAYRELSQKKMMGEFEQFVVTVWGEPPAAVGAIVDLQVVRQGDRLVMTNTI